MRACTDLDCTISAVPHRVYNTGFGHSLALEDIQLQYWFDGQAGAMGAPSASLFSCTCSDISQEISKWSDVSQEISKWSDVSREISKWSDVSREISKWSGVSREISKWSDVSREISKWSVVSREIKHG